MSDEKRVQDARHYWNEAASFFDNEPDHGLRDPLLAETWTTFLRVSLPYTRAAILDIGCGTGSLSVVLAGLGHTVTAVDVSPSMISIAKRKAEAHGVQVEFRVMDAAFPQLPGRQYDAIVCRHLLWTLPQPDRVLSRWADLLKPAGRLILIEGYWETGAGLHAEQILEILPASFTEVSLQDLSKKTAFWGKAVNDERYAIIADKLR